MLPNWHRSEALRARLEASVHRSETSAPRFEAFDPRLPASSGLYKASSQRCKASSRRYEDQGTEIPPEALKLGIRSFRWAIRSFRSPAQTDDRMALVDRSAVCSARPTRSRSEKTKQVRELAGGLFRKLGRSVLRPFTSARSLMAESRSPTRSKCKGAQNGSISNSRSGAVGAP